MFPASSRHKYSLPRVVSSQDSDSIVDVHLQVVRMVAENWAQRSLRIEPFKQEGRAREPARDPRRMAFQCWPLWLTSTGRMEQTTAPMDQANNMQSFDAAGRPRSEIARELHVSRIAVT